jgi:arylsulfatase A-like enzyme
MRSCWTIAIAFLALGCVEPEAPPESGPQERSENRVEAHRPNVLFVFFDQLRADVIGAYGGGANISTPNIDRLAGEGALFSNALSTTPVCSPYRGMLMTGRHPTHTGILLNFLEVPSNAHGIAEVFREDGYRTAFMGKWHLAAGGHKEAWVGQEGGSWEHALPFMEANPDYNYVRPGRARLGFSDWAAYNFHSSFYAAPYYGNTPQQRIMKGYETDALTTMAIEYMEAAREDSEPFFLMVAPHPPHPPFTRAPQEFLQDVNPQLQWKANVPQKIRTPRHATAATQYYAMCKNADHNLGRILDYLERSGLDEDTIVVFTSDHGEMLGSHGRFNKMVPYAEAIRIPLIVRWPGRIAAGHRTATLQTPLDHFPTLISLAGLSTTGDLDGVDLSSELLGGEAVARDAVLLSNYTAHWDFFKTYSDAGAKWAEWRGVKTQQYTYVRWLSGKTELYDDLEDLAQLNDLSDDAAFAPVVDALEAKLIALLAEAHDEFLPGNAYVDWVDDERNIIRTGLGLIQ